MPWAKGNATMRELRLTAGERKHAERWGITEKQMLAFLRNGTRNDPHRTRKGRRQSLSGREFEA